MSFNIEELKQLKLPKMQRVKPHVQAFAHICAQLRWILIIVAILLPMPYGTPAVYPNTHNIFPDTLSAILTELLLLSLALNAHTLYRLHYVLTYRDLRIFILRANRHNLLTSEITDVLIDIINAEQKFLKERRNKQNKSIIDEYTKTLDQRGIDLNIAKILDENLRLKEQNEQYKIVIDEATQEYLQIEEPEKAIELKIGE